VDMHHARVVTYRVKGGDIQVKFPSKPTCEGSSSCTPIQMRQECRGGPTLKGIWTSLYLCVNITISGSKQLTRT